MNLVFSFRGCDPLVPRWRACFETDGYTFVCQVRRVTKETFLMTGRAKSMLVDVMCRYPIFAVDDDDALQVAEKKMFEFVAEVMKEENANEDIRMESPHEEAGV